MKGFIGARQTTLASEISLTGTGVHSGAPVSITLCPADGDTGIRFLLSNGDAEGTEIAADPRSVTGVTLCTVLGDGNGASIATVEHLLAALSGLGVDNALIEIDSTEVPIMDGSASRFVEAIDEAGLAELEAPRRFLKVLKRIAVEDAGAFGELTPTQRFPYRRRDRFRLAADRLAEDRDRRQSWLFPPRAFPRPHLRLHEGRGAALGCGSRPWRFA